MLRKLGDESFVCRLDVYWATVFAVGSIASATVLLRLQKLGWPAEQSFEHGHLRETDSTRYPCLIVRALVRQAWHGVPLPNLLQLEPDSN